ncbi:MAG: aldolase/citrate lyase family protein, partial [bacterium]
ELGENRFSYVDKQINIETIQAVNNIENLLQTEQANHLKQITVGRHDLCRSMDRKPNDEDVLEATKHVIDVAREHGISGRSNHSGRRRFNHGKNFS